MARSEGDLIYNAELFWLAIRLAADLGIQFESRGAYELKGVPGTWQLSAVMRPGDSGGR